MFASYLFLFLFMVESAY